MRGTFDIAESRARTTHDTSIAEAVNADDPLKPTAPSAGVSGDAMRRAPLASSRGAIKLLPLVLLGLGLVVTLGIENWRRAWIPTLLDSGKSSSRSVLATRNKAAAEAATQAADQARLAETMRIAERARVEQGISGEWSIGSSGLTITRDGNAFNAVYLSAKGVEHHLSAQMLADNQLKLVSNQVGKLVNLFLYWDGDFSQETWIELGVDGSFLNVRFSQAQGGRSLVMNRTSGGPDSRVVEAPTVASAVSSVSVGTLYTCEVTTSGGGFCWGDNGHGGHGNGTAADSSTPVAVTGGLSIAMVSAGYYFTCWLTTGGAAYCAGANDQGQLGNGNSATDRPLGASPLISGSLDSSVPMAVAGGLSFSVVSVGYRHACALTTNGAAYCWGDNRYNQLGNGTSADSSIPVAVAGGMTFSTLSAGNAHTCAVTTGGAAYCWGAGGRGELGNGATASSAVPIAVSGGLTFASVTASNMENFTCGLTTSGSAYCWGDNDNLQLGNGQTGSSSSPIAVAGGLRFTALSAGSLHVCGVTTNGAAYCWGQGGWGQLGTGRTKDSLTPVAVASALTFASVSAGSLHTCGLTTGGAVYCWGDSGPRSLESSVPVAVRKLSMTLRH